MTHTRIIAALILGLSAAACSTLETATRNAPLESVTALAAEAPAAALRSVAVQSFTVEVPRALSVSEMDSYYPIGDIVWREDPAGDRHAQIRAIFDAAMGQAAPDVQGALPVDVTIRVRQFHALTEKTRQTIGGVHSITFDLALRDPATGVEIAAPRRVQVDLRGYGGVDAVIAEQQGLTQKTRITRHLANVLRAELWQPGSAPAGVTERVAGLEAAPI